MMAGKIVGLGFEIISNLDTYFSMKVPLEYVFGEGMKSPHSLSMLKNLWSEACGFFRHLSLEYGSERQPWGGGSDSAGSNFVTLIRALESNNKNFRYKTYSIAKGI